MLINMVIFLFSSLSLSLYPCFPDPFAKCYLINFWFTLHLFPHVWLTLWSFSIHFDCLLVHLSIVTHLMLCCCVINQPICCPHPLLPIICSEYPLHLAPPLLNALLFLLYFPPCVLSPYKFTFTFYPFYCDHLFLPFHGLSHPPIVFILLFFPPLFVYAPPICFVLLPFILMLLLFVCMFLPLCLCSSSLCVCSSLCVYAPPICFMLLFIVNLSVTSHSYVHLYPL